ncbi:MAG: dipicolinate synthase subunit B [Ruminococcaceae bacterium]|nr:dipicolinate synthase subunit B [Oscillospiraceae bacterium]
MNGLRIGYAVCGSFCTFSQTMPVLEKLAAEGADILPIMSDVAYNTDTRFGKAEQFRQRMEAACGRAIVHTIDGAEPIGPKKLLDVLVIAPCTGNTIAKLALGVTDTPVTMAAKAHLRNGRPLILAVATNDGLAASSKNIGLLMNTQNVYFVPFGQDDCDGKPNSLIAHFEQIPETISAAMEGRQLQPLLQ